MMNPNIMNHYISLIISLKNQFISANISLHSNRIIYLIDINIYKLFLYIFSNNRLLKNWIFNYYYYILYIINELKIF